MANTDPVLVPRVGIEDKVVWTLNANGCYTAKSAWMAFRSRALEVSWCHMVWHQHHVPRWSFFHLVSMMGGLATKDRLVGWRVLTNSSCVLCNGARNLILICSLHVLLLPQFG
ncbi:hypothetical protein Vadar_013653 [Vaccinium darrowii]|nr:hypothetical protein Vadar_013653 [Vaccinium darrowii]